MIFTPQYWGKGITDAKRELLVNKRIKIEISILKHYFMLTSASFSSFYHKDNPKI